MAAVHLKNDDGSVIQTVAAILVDATTGAPYDATGGGGGSTITALPQSTYKVAVTPAVTAATYAANKVIGGIMSFALTLPPTTFAALLESITIKFKSSVQTGGFYVAVFSASPGGTFTDTNTAAILAADSALLLGLYHLSTAQSPLGTHTIYSLDGINHAINGSTQGLWVVVVPDATTAALGSTADMTVELGLLWG